MMPYGLFHTSAQLALARSNREVEPIAACLRLLDSPPADAISAAYFAGLRYQLDGIDQTAERAMRLLRKELPPPPNGDDRGSLQDWLGWLSAAALLRDDAGDLPDALSNACADLPAMVAHLKSPGDALDRLWLGALGLAIGILLRHEAPKRLGADVYRGAIDDLIHPEGYLKGIVDDENRQGTYAAQVSGCCALTAMAEMAACAGLDLWAYDNRGVTPITAATYTLYYYFYPEQWRWGAGLTRRQTSEAMRREGAFMEIVNRRDELRGIDEMLAEQRPMFCAYGGGLTSLTHGLEAPKKRGRWSWR